MKYELELNTGDKSLTRIQELITNLWNILKLQHDDSFNGIDGGASPHYILKIDVEEKWI